MRGTRDKSAIISEQSCCPWPRSRRGTEVHRTPRHRSTPACDRQCAVSDPHLCSRGRCGDAAIGPVSHQGKARPTARVPVPAAASRRGATAKIPEPTLEHTVRQVTARCKTRRRTPLGPVPPCPGRPACIALARWLCSPWRRAHAQRAAAACAEMPSQYGRTGGTRQCPSPLRHVRCRVQTPAPARPEPRRATGYCTGLVRPK